MALWGAVCAMRGVGCARLRRAGAGDGERRRAERGEGCRERAQGRETASPMVLHCVVGEEVAATLRTSEIRLGGSFFV